MGEKRFDEDCRGCIFWGAVLFLAALCVSFPAFSTGHIIAGADAPFHLGRIEGIAEGLQAGQFPVRVNPVQAGGYGMMTGFFYPDVFLYIPAMLRLLGMPLIICWKLTFLGTHLLTAFLSWRAFSVAARSRQTGAIAALFYLVAFFRLLTGYVTTDIGALLAMAFLPAALVFIWVTLRRDAAYWPAAVACSAGVFLSHILTSLFLILATVLMLAISFRHLCCAETREAVGRSAGFLFLLTIWFYGPLLYLHWHMDYVMKRVTQQSAWLDMVYAPQDFDFYVGSAMLVLVLVLAMVLAVRHRAGGAGGFWRLLMAAFVIVFLASFLPLWEMLGSLGGPIQFPGRLAIFSAILLSLAAAIGIRQIGLSVNAERGAAILGAGVVFGENLLWMAGMSYRMPPYAPGQPTLIESRMAVQDYLSRFDVRADGGADYMDAAAYDHLMAAWPEIPDLQGKLRRQTEEQVIRPMDRIAHVERMGNAFTLQCTAGEEEWIRLPMYWYPGYVAEMAGTGRLLLRRGEDGCIIVSLPSSEDDMAVRVSYEGLPWFHVTDMVSWFSLTGFLYAAVRLRQKRRNYDC